ncbi:MAG: DUF3536 domain-containing protein [Chloroflexota bacterium]|jgi:alpha-amylase/alpha-mannosidase (GH57 family)
MSEQAVSIHGHYYQPAREDPLTGEVPKEEGAQPYRNWNERIHEQCYRPNAELGNFEKISFDLGPTLINWMISHDPATFARIVEQEQRNYDRYGVGNGMAQPYHHTILPLATRHDKLTQIRWGLADFEHRFCHRPTGMWLPETAVDYETLQILAEEGIEFTILAPWQADAADINIAEPYLVELENGERMSVFFYDAELSMRVSFDPGSTANGDRFVSDYVIPRFPTNGHGEDHPRLLIIASDGELYGHHQPFRDKFLFYLTRRETSHPPMLKFTYPGLWLRQHAPVKKIQIRSNTSWSCHHGVSRWKEACPCASNGDWKAQLRKAMNQIAAAVDEQFVRAVSPYLRDPWDLLYRYIEVLHGNLLIYEYIEKVFARQVNAEEKRKIDLLLRSQLCKQRMFTSCGWFFEDFDRLEPRLVVVSAAQAIWWMRLATHIDLIPQAQEWLGKVRSWRSSLRADMVFNGYIERLRYEQLAFPFVQTEIERF